MTRVMERVSDRVLRRVPVSTSLVTAALASAGAGLVHAAAAGSHSGEPALGWLFALCAIAQLGWAGFMVLQPRRAVVAGGVLFNAGCVVVWALTRTMRVGGPFGDVEPVGFPDLLAASFAAVVVVAGCLALMGRGDARRRLDVPAVGLASALVLALAVPAMAAGHTHGDDHAPESGEVAIAAGASGHTHAGAAATAGTDGAEQDVGDAVEATGPIISLDDPRLTKEQRARAQKLLSETRAALRAFPDEAAVLAAGYVSIGDGRRVGRFEHFVNRAYVVDGRELDPNAIESIVLQRQADGTKKVVSAMYILGPGKTMADVPDVAGELTPWHDHQNLCWDETGTRLAGVLVNGVCVPGGTFRGTSPMMHVWLEDTPCGPFSGIEGHGGACEHDHAFLRQRRARSSSTPRRSAQGCTRVAGRTETVHEDAGRRCGSHRIPCGPPGAKLLSFAAWTTRSRTSPTANACRPTPSRSRPRPPTVPPATRASRSSAPRS